MQQRREDPQITGNGSLAGEQQKHALVDLETAPVDPDLGGDDQFGELDVMVSERRERAVKLPDHEIDFLKRLTLALFEVLAELVAGLVHRPNRTARA